MRNNRNPQSSFALTFYPTKFSVLIPHSYLFVQRTGSAWGLAKQFLLALKSWNFCEIIVCNLKFQLGKNDKNVLLRNFCFKFSVFLTTRRRSISSEINTNMFLGNDIEKRHVQLRPPSPNLTLSNMFIHCCIIVHCLPLLGITMVDVLMMAMIDFCLGVALYE